MIVEEINAIIAATTGLNEESMQLFGLADPVIVRDMGGETQIPVIIDADGECHDVLLDDNFDMSLFHRLNKKTYTTITSEGFGNDPKRVCVHDMSLFVSGKRSAIDMYRLEHLCVDAIEKVCAGKKRVKTEAVDTDFNRIRVFAAEYSGLPFPLQPDIFLFKVNYKLTREQSPC